MHLGIPNREQHRELASTREQGPSHEELGRNDGSRKEIGALIDRNGGDIDRMIQSLKSIG